MVEALVANGLALDAWRLVQDLAKDDKTRSLLNTVVYATIIKGFANTRKIEKVRTVYKDMKAQQIQPNKITFNAILNAYAECGDMQHVASLLTDMKASSPPIEPDLI